MSKKLLKEYITKINNIRTTREKEDVFKQKIDMPVLGIKRIAEMCMDQDSFVMREMLVQSLLRFYACNTGIFMCAMSKELRAKVEFDEKYIDECLVDIAELLMEGKVFLFYDGVFSGWCLHRQRKSDKPVTWDAAIKFCNMLVEGDF